MTHECEYNVPYDAYGAAIEQCSEYEDGELWVGNGEYASRVNYCPFCGYKAVSQWDLSAKFVREREDTPSPSVVAPNNLNVNLISLTANGGKSIFSMKADGSFECNEPEKK